MVEQGSHSKTCLEIEGKKITNFTELKDTKIEQFSDPDYLKDFLFLVDITHHLSVLNKQNGLTDHIHGCDQLIHELFYKINDFIDKLYLWHKQLSEGVFTHFETLITQNATKINGEKYTQEILILLNEFEHRFQDFKSHSIAFQIFGTPFNVEVEEVQAHFQLKLIDFQADGELWVKYMRRQTLIDFYKFALPRTNFPNLYEHSIQMSSFFGSTYVCEALFSKMKCANRNIDDVSLIQILRIRYAFPIPVSIQN